VAFSCPLSNIPRTFMRIFTGANTGKQLLKIADSVAAKATVADVDAPVPPAADRHPSHAEPPRSFFV